MNNNNLETLINGCAKGKNKARRELFNRYKRELLGICMRYARDKSEAEDILLEGFIQIYSKVKTYEGRGSFEGWMKRIIVNTAIDYFRKYRRENMHQNIDDYMEVTNPDQDAFMKLNEKEILTLIQSLPAGYRVVFNLFAIEGYSHAEIADRLGITVSTSKSQLRKARAKLVHTLENN